MLKHFISRQKDEKGSNLNAMRHLFIKVFEKTITLKRSEELISICLPERLYLNKTKTIHLLAKTK